MEELDFKISFTRNHHWISFLVPSSFPCIRQIGKTENKSNRKKTKQLLVRDFKITYFVSLKLGVVYSYHTHWYFSFAFIWSNMIYQRTFVCRRGNGVPQSITAFITKYFIQLEEQQRLKFKFFGDIISFHCLLRVHDIDNNSGDLKIIHIYL